MEYSKLLTVLEIRDLLNNIIIPLTLNVDEVFYIYHHDFNQEIIKNIDSIIKKYKKIKTHFICLKNDDEEIDEILNNNEDIVIDIGGEKYLSLVLFDKAISRENLIIYYDNEENTIKSYNDHLVLYKDVFKFDIEDMMKLGGGKIIEYLHDPVSKDDELTINILNKTIEASINSYQAFTSFVQKVNSLIDKKNKNNKCIYNIKNNDSEKILTDEQYHKYRDLGLLKIEDNKVIFPSEKIAKLFEVSGAFLENYLYLKLTDSAYFDEVKMSTVVDFSGKIRRYPIVCEIDCLVIKDNHLLFVSCKSNKVDTDALNEIKVHNEMFGNLLSDAVLCTLDDLNIKSPSVYGKARELGVKIVDNTDFENDMVAEKFKSIIDDSYNYERLR